MKRVRVICNIFLIILCYLPQTALANSYADRELDKFYIAIKDKKHHEAKMILHLILNKDPTNKKALLSLGYLDMLQNKTRMAANYFAIAYANYPSARLALQTGYAKSSSGESQAAYKYFGFALHTKNTKIYDDACQSSIYTSPYLQSPLPPPWYTSLYFAPFYESRISDTIFPLKIRIGHYLGSTRSFSVYGYFHLSDDLRSSAGVLPQIYNDNYTSLGIGVDWYPFSDHSLRIFAETGSAYSLLKKKHLWRNDTTTGAEGYWNWGGSPGCGLYPRWPLTQFGDLYISAAYYSRYQDGIAQWNVREGLRIFHYGFSSLSAFAEIDGTADTGDVYYNNILEIGPGVSLRPDQLFPLDFRAEYLFGRYFRGSPSGVAKGYQTWLIEAIINF